MPPSEAQKKAKAGYKARMTKAGARHFGLWLSAEAWVALEALAKVHGSKVKAVEVAICALARPQKAFVLTDAATGEVAGTPAWYPRATVDDAQAELNRRQTAVVSQFEIEPKNGPVRTP